MMGILEGKVAVITGGTRGLGLAIARAFSGEGAQVVIAGRSATSVDRAMAELKASGAEASGMACDVAEAEQVRALARFALKPRGHFDLWVNNAGAASPYGPTFAAPLDEFERVTRTNIMGTYYGTRAALEHFLPRRSGKLINVMGRGARRAAPMQNPYGASKAWVRSFTEALAKEYADSGVGIFMLAPGMMRTDMLLHPTVYQGYGERLGGTYQAVLRMWSKPPEMAARRALWLAGPATDGKSGLQARGMGSWEMLAGLLRELGNRLVGRTETFPVQAQILPPEPFGLSSQMEDR